ncbi:MAG: hypothetical protein LBC21_00470, partial [Oscillospiraceae bacterium]|nr:hypothetical protein [Oscillospiraceae bacterium]
MGLYVSPVGADSLGYSKISVVAEAGANAVANLRTENTVAPVDAASINPDTSYAEDAAVTVVKFVPFELISMAVV